MPLQEDFIIKQLCYELKRSKELNLRARHFIGDGTKNIQIADFNRYKLKLIGGLVKTGDDFDALEYYLDESRQRSSRFYTDYDHETNPNATKYPETPSFCATTIFQPIIVKDQLSLRYNEDELANLINLAIKNGQVFKNAVGLTNGVQIAAETNNEQMLIFLLRPEFSDFFDLKEACLSLLRNANIKQAQIRLIIFKTCAERVGDNIDKEMMNALLQEIRTLEEWRAFFDSFRSVEKRNELIECCTAELWSKLITNEAQLNRVESVVMGEQLTDFFQKLLTVKDRFYDSYIILKLMERMNQAERLNYAIQLSNRINDLFSSSDGYTPLSKCLTLLGYVINENGDVTLRNIFGPPELSEHFPLMNQLHTAIWNSSFNNQMKLNYFHMTQQLLIAPRAKRAHITQRYLQCMQEGERLLVARAEAKRGYFLRWIRSILRFFGLIKPMPITEKAQLLFKKVSAFFSRNPTMHATLLDLNEVILPEESQASDRRILAITKLTERRYDAFWNVMQQAERDNLLKDKHGFSQLLKTRDSRQDICQLIQGLGDAELDRFLDFNQEEKMFLHLLQQEMLPIPELMHSIGERRRTNLLADHRWLQEILLRLPNDRLKSFLSTFTEAQFIQHRNSFPHLQMIAAIARIDQYRLVVQHFGWGIPLTHAAPDIGELLNALPMEKIASFWSTFLQSREFSADEMQELIRKIQSDEQKEAILTHWMTLFPSTPWSSSLIKLIPHMTHEQQASFLRKITINDLVKLIENNQVEELIRNFTRSNADKLIERYRNELTTKEQFIRFLHQMSTFSIDKLTSRAEYGYFRLLGSQNFVNFIRELKPLNEEQWERIRPKLFQIGSQLFPNDPEINLFKQHVPPESHEHLLNVFRELSEQGLPGLLSFFSQKTVATLIKHRCFKFDEITTGRIDEMLDVNTHQQSDLKRLCDEEYGALIQSHIKTIHDELNGLRTELTDAEKGLFFQLEIQVSVGFFGIFGSSSSHRSPKDSIMKQWNFIVARYNRVHLLHGELTKFYDANRFREGIAAFRPIHEKLDALKTTLEIYIKNKSEINRPGLHLTFPAASTPNVDFCVTDALNELKMALEKLDEEDEKCLLDTVQGDLPAIMNEADALQEILDLTSASKNQELLISRCRSYLSTAPTAKIWLERLKNCSPSSLKILLNGLKEVLFPRSQYTDFFSLIAGFRALSFEQWNVICQDIINNGNQYFGKVGLWVVLTRDVPNAAHQHILNLIRNSENKGHKPLIEYLQSDTVRQLRSLNIIQNAHYSEITIEQLPSLLDEAVRLLRKHSMDLSAQINQDMDGLKNEFQTGTDQSRLMNLLRPEARCYSFVKFGEIPAFNVKAIQEKLSSISKRIAILTKKLTQFQNLCSIDRTLDSESLLETARNHLNNCVSQLNLYRTAPSDKQFLNNIPQCAYDGITATSTTDYIKTLSSDFITLFNQTSTSRRSTLSPERDTTRSTRSSSMPQTQ
jgi:hypothetical protein